MTEEKRQEILNTYADLKEDDISMERLFAMATAMCEVEYVEVVSVITADIKEKADQGEKGCLYTLGNGEDE